VKRANDRENKSVRVARDELRAPIGGEDGGPGTLRVSHETRVIRIATLCYLGKFFQDQSISIAISMA
jgi:hypothetical protein